MNGIDVLLAARIAAKRDELATVERKLSATRTFLHAFPEFDLLFRGRSEELEMMRDLLVDLIKSMAAEEGKSSQKDF